MNEEHVQKLYEYREGLTKLYYEIGTVIKQIQKENDPDCPEVIELNQHFLDLKESVLQMIRVTNHMEENDEVSESDKVIIKNVCDKMTFIRERILVLIGDEE